MSIPYELLGNATAGQALNEAGFHDLDHTAFSRVCEKEKEKMQPPYISRIDNRTAPTAVGVPFADPQLWRDGILVQTDATYIIRYK